MKQFLPCDIFAAISSSPWVDGLMGVYVEQLELPPFKVE